MSHKVFVDLDVSALEVKTEDVVFKIEQPVVKVIRPASRPFASGQRRSISANREDSPAISLLAPTQTDGFQTRSTVTTDCYQRRKKFGELRVSRGAVVWRGRNDQLGRKISWRRFADSMDRAASRAERRAPGTRLSVPKRRLRDRRVGSSLDAAHRHMSCVAGPSSRARSST